MRNESFALNPSSLKVFALVLAVAAIAAFSLLTSAGAGATSTAATTKPVKQIDVGEGHACALDFAGKVTCWGDDSRGQVSGWDMPYADETFASISAGGDLTCGTKTDGSVMCWGYPYLEDGTSELEQTLFFPPYHMTFAESQSNPPILRWEGWVDHPDSTVKFKPGTVSVGKFRACGIRTNGTIACWGHWAEPFRPNPDGGLIVPLDSNDQIITDWVQVDSGHRETCGLRADGSVVCWGHIPHTHGPDDDHDHDEHEDEDHSAGPFEEIAVGIARVCGLEAEGSVECFGFDETDVDDYPFTTIDVSIFNSAPRGGTYYYGCGILTDAQGGGIKCFEVPEHTMDLGEHQTPDEIFTPPAGKFASISVGGGVSCALDTEGFVHCWGEPNGADSVLSVPSMFRPSATLQSVQLLHPNQLVEPGSRLRFEAEFDHAVEVTGTPQLSFKLDGESRHASYVSGDQSNTLYFEYVFLEEDAGSVNLMTGSSRLDCPSGTSIMGIGAERPTTSIPGSTPNPEVVLKYNLAAARVSRIEPSIRSVIVSAGEQIRLDVDVYGAQDIKENDLADGIGFLWDDGDGGGVFDGNGREVTYTPPSQPGTYMISVSVPLCRAPITDEIRCEATIELRVRRPSAPQPAEEVSVNPSGEIPSILTDADGNQYEVFTPVEGGAFSGEAYSINVDPGAVPNGEFIGIRMSDDGAASNLGMTHQRYTLGGNMYGVHAVDSSGAAVSSYVLDGPGTVCVPLPDELRQNISDLALVAINGDGSLTILSAQVRLGDAGTMVCGKLSGLPASVAVGSAGAPPAIPTATPEPVPETPDTGGQAPSSNWFVWMLLIAFVGLAAGYAAIRVRR